jgi:TldD protein
MLNPQVAQKVLALAIERGASFADIFVEEKKSQSFSILSSQVQNVNSGINFGIGVRVVFGKDSLYAYSNSDKEDVLLKLTDELCSVFKRGEQTSVKLQQFQSLKYPYIRGYNDQDVTLEHKIARMSKIDQTLRQRSKFVEQVSVSLNQYQQNIEVFNTLGVHAQEIRPYIRIATQLMLKDGDKKNATFMGPGSRGGWSFAENFNIDQFSDELTKMAETTLHADECPAGKMPVVIDNGFGGVIFHEACGHLLETTAVEKKSSVFWDKKGEMIAHEALSATDDGTIDNGWGSLSIDDEGMPTQRTVLIKNGRLENFMSDYLGSIKTGHPRTGSARRESYRFAPASRMRNTFIEPGPHKKEALIASVPNGLYAKKMGGGSVNPGTGEFNFSVEEAYLIKDGKISKPVKGAVLIGKGAEIMQRISMVADNLDLSAGMCGSVSGSIPASVGQPAVKVDEILVGGRA